MTPKRQAAGLKFFHKIKENINKLTTKEYYCKRKISREGKISERSNIKSQISERQKGNMKQNN